MGIPTLDLKRKSAPPLESHPRFETKIRSPLKFYCFRYSRVGNPPLDLRKKSAPPLESPLGQNWIENTVRSKFIHILSFVDHKIYSSRMFWAFARGLEQTPW